MPQQQEKEQQMDLPAYLKNNKYPAKAHNLQVVTHLGAKASHNAHFLIPAEEVEPVKYCDITKPFRQERYFYYLSGVPLPGAYVHYDVANAKLTLYLPDVDEDDVMWSGMPLSREEALAKFDVDAVKYVSELVSDLKPVVVGQDCTVYTTDLDHFAKEKFSCEFVERLTAGDRAFFDALDESRLIKDQYEIETLRHAAKISDNAHLAVMSALPIERNELQIQAEFEYHSTRQGARSLGYDPICCSGPACGTLHYVKNDAVVTEKKASVLIDAGSEWENYTTDVTRCFPLSGRFTAEHRAIYEAVREMQSSTMAMMQPGQSWDELHALSHKVLIKHLLKAGILKSDFSEEELFESRVSVGFYPHGLGHLMGLDVHDVGGHANYEDADEMFQYLRLRRDLQAGMVVTNEPGCYFNEFLLDNYIRKHEKRAAMVDFDVVAKYMYVGGVRIEDDVLITAAGHENLTGITSDPEEIEKIVSEGLKRPRSDFHVIV